MPVTSFMREMASSSRKEYCSIQPPICFFAIRNMKLLIGKRMCLFWGKKLHFLTVLFKWCCCSEINPLLMPALVGQRDQSRSWETLGERRNDSEVKYCHEENTSLACMAKLTTPGVCKCIFVLKEFVSQQLSQLWGALRDGRWREKGVMWTDPCIQQSSINGPGMLQL